MANLNDKIQNLFDDLGGLKPIIHFIILYMIQCYNQCIYCNLIIVDYVYTYYDRIEDVYYINKKDVNYVIEELTNLGFYCKEFENKVIVDLKSECVQKNAWWN